jgi:hypothetical protein
MVSATCERSAPGNSPGKDRSRLERSSTMLLRHHPGEEQKNALTDVRAFENLTKICVNQRLVALCVAAVSTAAAATAAGRTARAATGAIFARAGFIDGQGPVHEIATVEKADGLLGFFCGRHRHEAKAAGFAGEFILHQSGFGDRAGLGEMILKIVFGGIEGKISDVEFSGHIVICSICGAVCGCSQFLGLKTATDVRGRIHATKQLAIYHALRAQTLRRKETILFPAAQALLIWVSQR